MILHPREITLLNCIAQDWSTTKIASEMRITKSTIAVMKHNLRAKMNKEYRTPHGLYRWAQENKEELKV